MTQPFEPMQYHPDLTVDDAGVELALNGHEDVMITNFGAHPCYIKFGEAVVFGTGLRVPKDSMITLHCAGRKLYAICDATQTTTLNITGGKGL